MNDPTDPTPQSICRRNVVRFAKAVNTMRDYSKETMRDSGSEAEAWSKILAHPDLSSFSQEGRIAIVRKSLDGTIELNRLIRVVCLIQRAFKRYKERKRQRILAESEAMSLNHIKEMIKESEEQRMRQFQELKERVQRLSEQNYKLFSELLYQHKFAKTA